MAKKISYAEKLESLFTMAVTEKDTCMALEIADRLKGLQVDTVGAVVDERITKFIGILDRMVERTEGTEKKIRSYQFEYGGQNFKVGIL